jgi:hypothetical protein
MHPKSKHTLFECVSLRKSLNAPLPDQDGKRKDQEDGDEGDKLGAKDYQDPKNVVNAIFKPGKFPLILDRVVADSYLTWVLIDGESSLNLVFTSTLKKMGLNITKMLTPSKAPFYSIVPGNAATLLGSVVLPITFGTKDNYRTGVHQVRGGRLRVVIPHHPW